MKEQNALESVHEDIREFYLDDDFTKTEFQAEFGGDAEYPQILSDSIIAVISKRH